MTDLTRRDSLKLSAAASLAALMPLYPARAFTPAPEDAQLTTLLAQVEREVGDFMEKSSAELLDGVYARIFTRRTSVTPNNKICHFGPGELGRGDCSPRWIYNAENQGRGWFFRVVPDDGQVMPAKDRVLKLDGLRKGLNDLTVAHQRERETDAASIFNFARTYDASVGGDGQSVCSISHPHDKGVCANTFHIQCDITPTTLADALSHIEKQWVDCAGNKIVGYGRQLVVHPDNEAQAKASLKGLRAGAFPQMATSPILWSGLAKPDNWFVLTNQEGLVRYERGPFTINCWVDSTTNSVVVDSWEDGRFACSDPLAIFGSFPA